MAPARSTASPAVDDAQAVTVGDDEHAETRPMRATGGRFRLLEQIGTGATATVWRARDTRLGTDVALKRFHPHLVADPVARQRFEHEAEAVKRLSHPNIVSAIDGVTSADEVSLVFPFIAGKTLAWRLEEGPALDDRAAAAIAADIADALAAAHVAGVVHRDVKPSNILLGDDGRARLLDFGISRTLVDEIGGDRQLTGAGLTIGTLPYMAPEQLAAEPVAAASDVYGLGVVLYEMLSGRRPYAAASPVALAAEQREPPPGIEGRPAEVVAAASAALAVDAAARPSAGQLARTLRGFLDGRADAGAPTTVVPAIAPLRPAAAAAVPIAPVARKAPPPQEAAAVVPPRRRGGVLAAAAVVALVLAVGGALAAFPGVAEAPAAHQGAELAPVTDPTPTPTPAATAEPAAEDRDGAAAPNDGDRDSGPRDEDNGGRGNGDGADNDDRPKPAKDDDKGKGKSEGKGRGNRGDD